MKRVRLEDGKVIPESDAAMKAFFREPGRVHFVGYAERPGVSDCVQTLEHRHYKPLTPRNDLLILRMINWGGLSWIVVSIPEDEKPLMEKCAAAHGLKLVQGVQTLISASGVERFPVRGKNVYVLENVPGHPMYSKK